MIYIYIYIYTYIHVYIYRYICDNDNDTNHNTPYKDNNNDNKNARYIYIYIYCHISMIIIQTYYEHTMIHTYRHRITSRPDRPCAGPSPVRAAIIAIVIITLISNTYC